MLRRVRQGLQHFQALAEVGDRFGVCRALDGALARLLPVEHRLGTEARFGVVMRHQLRLQQRSVGELRFQHLRNTLVILLPRTL